MKPPAPNTSGIRPEFAAKVDKLIASLEAKHGVNFTPAEEKKIVAAPSPEAKAAELAKAHHAQYQSRQGGKFGAGKVGAGYYKQKEGGK